jgi:hypothetical protein
VVSLDNDRLTFKESKLVSAIGFNLFFALLFSAIPEWSTKFWLMNTAVAMFFIIRTVYAWLTMTDSKRYFSIGSYGMIFMAAFVGPQPIIRLLWIGESHLWILFVATWLLVFIVTHLSKWKIGKMFKDPFDSKGGRIFHILFLIVIILLPFIMTFTSQEGTTIAEQYIEFMAMGAVTYIISLLCLFMLPAFLIKPEEMDSL